MFLSFSKCYPQNQHREITSKQDKNKKKLKYFFKILQLIFFLFISGKNLFTQHRKQYKKLFLLASQKL